MPRSRLVLAALAAAFLAGCLKTPTSTQPKAVAKAAPMPSVGKEAPEITGTDADGKTFRLSDYRGKAILLDFWASW